MSALRTRLRSALLAAFVFCPSAFAVLPPIGSGDVAIADPDIPPPPTEPCVVTLYDQFTFIGFDAQTFDFAPPDDCPGPWQKVVLSADFDVTAGRQFDRTAEIWLGGANLYFGTTQEPNAAVAPTWHIERDVTDLSPLFASMQAGRVDLGNVVDNTYTGIIHGSASLVFYPYDATVSDRPPRPDVVVPMAADATGGTVTLASDDDHLVINFTPPTNIRRAFLDVIAEAQNTDEFWYLCVPDEVADELQSCPGTGFREAQVTIDGLYVGIAPIYPWIYTGGIDPGLWRPTPGIQTLSFQPYRVDLTPYAAWLSSGQPHRVAVRVFNAQAYFSATANLLLYLDHGADTVDGEVTMNTLEGADPTVDTQLSTDADGDISGIVSVGSQHVFEIEGYVDTSDGRVTTHLSQGITFHNNQIFNIDATTYEQSLDLGTDIFSQTKVTVGSYVHVVTENVTFPLAIDYKFDTTSDGFAQTTTVDQRLERTVDFGLDGFGSHEATLKQHMATADTLLIDASGNATGRTDQGSAQTYTYLDPYGTCYDRTITTDTGVLASVTDGTACPDGVNTLPSFDSFHNAGSLTFGATLQILP
jgi:hypothetical protein